MATTAETLRAYRGPAILSFGFRPFFLGGALWAVIAMAIFVGLLWGGLQLPTAMSPIDWHIHELLYGFLPAIVAGFLLTAVPNWTGRLPVAGTPLALLFAAWLAGRGAVAFSSVIGPVPAAILDLAFLAGLSAVIAREIIAGKNVRNLKVLFLVGLLAVGNAIFHIEIIMQGIAGYGIRFGVGAAIMLIILIGGRIVPSFTRNWLARRKSKPLPVPFNRYDAIAIAVAMIAIASWIAIPESLLTAAFAVVAGIVHTVRLVRWKGILSFSEPLVTVLHAGYGFVPLGFLLLGLSIVRPDILLPSAAIHGWTAGAVGLMTLAVMTRATLGHSGRDLTASPGIVAIYMAAGTGAFARIAAGFDFEPEFMLKLGALGWMLAFGGFCALFAPLLAGTRRTG